MTRRRFAVAALAGSLVLAGTGARLAGLRAERSAGEGTLIAVFAMQRTLLLCSDGRIVRASDGAILREDYRKVHRLTPRIGLLTAGRDLPDLMTRLTTSLAGRSSATFDEVSAVTHDALATAWQALPKTGDGRPSGRAFAYVAGFDEHDRPRLVQLDSASARAFRIDPVALLDGGMELDVAALATTSGPNEDVSALIVRHIDRLARSQPALDRLRLLQSAFEASKAELSLRNPRIGGATFAATITLDEGYRDLSGR